MPDFDSRGLAAVYGGAHGAWGGAMIALTVLGSGWSALALLPLIGWPRTRAFASFLTLAIVAQATAVWVIKHAVGRVRPWISLGLPAPIGAPQDGSFPSGHAAGSFCVAAFLVVALPSGSAATWRVRVIPATAVALATLIGVSRVYLGAHFPSDVAAGAVFGSIVGAAAGALHRLRERERKRLVLP